MIEGMKTISLGPCIEATDTARFVPAKTLALQLHAHRDIPSDEMSVIDMFEEMPCHRVLEAAVGGNLTLEERSAKVIHSLELDKEDSCGAYADELDKLMSRYLGPFTQSRFFYNGREFVIVTSLTASYVSAELDEMELPYYSTIIGTPHEVSAIVIFATLSERMDAHEELVATDWFGLTDITHTVFADLLELEFAGGDLC